jgi:chromosome segregation ATPase
MEELLTSSQSLEKTKKRLEGDLDEMNKTLEGEIKNRAALNKKYQALEKSLSDSQRRVKELEAGAGSAATINKLQADLRKVRQQLEDSEAQVSTVSDAKKKAEGEVTSLREELEQAKKELADHKGKLAALVSIMGVK